jgi:hypothetical protein
MWIDIAAIVFVCTAVNHLGLIKAIQTVTKCNRLPIVSCPKCLTFWSVLAYELWCVGFLDLPMVLAISFLCSYLAIWLELIMYAIDTLYNRIYGILENNNEEDRDEEE